MKTPIKYDKVFQKVCRFLMIVTGGILLLFGILLLIDMKKAVDISNPMVVLLLAAYASIPLFPLSLVAAFSVSTADSMTRYVYRSRTAAESGR